MGPNVLAECLLVTLVGHGPGTGGHTVETEEVMPRFVHVQAENPDATTILIAGLPRPLTLLQITDSHLAEVDERDPLTFASLARPAEPSAPRWPTDWEPRRHLRAALTYANHAQVDYVVLTGDILHFPSAANLETLEQELKALAAPYLYMCGNHDWQFPHLPANERTRAEYRSCFDRFTDGTPSFQAREVGGVRLLALDNSTYQVDDAQLGFLRQQVAADLPCLLFMHIPLYTPALAPPVVDKWGAPIMLAALDWNPAAQADWQVRDPDASTLAFHRLLTEGEAPIVAAAFSGHVHFTHAAPFAKEQMQYVTRPGFDGGSRLIRLLPA